MNTILNLKSVIQSREFQVYCVLKIRELLILTRTKRFVVDIMRYLSKRLLTNASAFNKHEISENSYLILFFLSAFHIK